MNLLGKKNQSDSVEERERYESAIKLVATKITTLQSRVKKSEIDVGVNCFYKISEEIEKSKMDTNLISVIQSEFQADATLAGSVNLGEADIVISADSDLAVLLGDGRLSIKKIYFNDQSKTKVLKDFELFSTGYNMFENIINILGLAMDNIIHPKKIYSRA
jgi:hypothetical protein